MTNANARQQGTAVVEFHDGNFLVMLPDGQVRSASDVGSVQKIVKKWCRAELNLAELRLGKSMIGFCKIEWRGHAEMVVPDESVVTEAGA